MIPDSYFPAIISGFFVIVGLLLSRYMTVRDKRDAEHKVKTALDLVETSEVTKAKIDDGSQLRGELWTRIVKLENDAALERASYEKEIAGLRADLNAAKLALAACSAAQKLQATQLDDARREINELVIRLQAERGK